MTIPLDGSLSQNPFEISRQFVIYDNCFIIDLDHKLVSDHLYGILVMHVRDLFASKKTSNLPSDKNKDNFKLS